MQAFRTLAERKGSVELQQTECHLRRGSDIPKNKRHIQRSNPTKLLTGGNDAQDRKKDRKITSIPYSGKLDFRW